jgi:hypothetical protein
MKLRSLLFSAALGFAAQSLFADITKPDEDSGGSAQIRFGPISVAVSVDASESMDKKSAYLGVVTSALLPQLRAQLDLAEGMGLVIDAVAKESPAEKAGLKKFDVLKKFNDQMICTQDQLAVLVKATGAGNKVSLGIIRGGKEQTVEVTLGEHVSPDPGNAHFYINGLPGTSVPIPGLEALENYYQSHGGPASGGIQEHLKEQRAEIQKRVDDAIHKAQEAARGAGRPGMPGGPKVFSVYPETRTSSHNVVVVTDNEGTVEVSESDGQKSVKIKDAGGQEIFAGALNSDIDHEGVPEKYRAKVKDAEDRIKANMANATKKAPKRPQALPQPQIQPAPVLPPAPPAPPAPLPPGPKPGGSSI